jgi:hypothetical protein
MGYLPGLDLFVVFVLIILVVIAVLVEVVVIVFIGIVVGLVVEREIIHKRETTGYEVGSAGLIFSRFGVG